MSISEYSLIVAACVEASKRRPVFQYSADIIKIARTFEMVGLIHYM